MTQKQTKYKVNRILGMDKYNAARAAGYSETTCHAKSYQFDGTLDKVGITNDLIRAGVTPRKLAIVVSEGLIAVKANGEPDHDMRRKYAELALKIFGLLEESTIFEKHTHFTYIREESQREDSLQAAALPAGDRGFSGQV